MGSINVTSASLKKKKSLLEKLAIEVKELEEREKLKLNESSEKINSLQKIIEDIASEHFMEPIEIIKLLEAKFKPSRKRSPSYPKYFNPDDASVTWTGRGRHPLWVKAILDRGEDIERYRIQG